MRAVVQRVTEARVRVDGRTAGAIGRGLLVFVGIARDDGPGDVEYLAGKIPALRVFESADGKPMDRSVAEVGGSLLIVSQFTLYGDTRGQRRPSFIAAAPPEQAKRLYEEFSEALRRLEVTVATGVFQAMMSVDLVNDGPVTILLDSDKTF